MTALPSPLQVLPHRPPFLFLDEVTSCDENSATAYRVYRAEEDFFRGHFPGHAIVPGVILIESMAQTFAYCRLLRHSCKNLYLTSIDRAHFRKPVHPGERVDFSIHVEGTHMGVVAVQAYAHVGGVKVADARLSGVGDA